MELNITFFIQLGAFLATVLIVSNLAFGPVLKTLDERHKRIEGAREEAARLAGSSGSQADTIEKKLSAARASGQEEMTRLKTEAEKQEAEMLAAARFEASAELDAARARLKTATTTARDQLGSQARTLADAIVSKALGRNA